MKKSMSVTMLLVAIVVSGVIRINAHRGGMHKHHVVGHERDTQALAMLQQELDGAIQAFKTSAVFGELTLQQMLEILDTERTLVDYLKEGRSGYVVVRERKLQRKQLAHAIPSIKYIYDKILCVATYDERLGYNVVLHRADKRAFLGRMDETLRYYYALLRNMQYGISIGNQGVVAQAIAVERGDSVAHFCPVSL